MGFKEDLMLRKIEPLVKQEFGRGSYKEEYIKMVIKETKEAVNDGRIKRYEDLKNFIHAKFDELSKEKYETGPVA